MRDYYAKRRQDWIESRGGACEKCGSRDGLEVDHINRADKAINIGKLWTSSQVRRDAELSKCQVLCSACHQEKTSSEMSVEHGGGVSGKGGCKCDLCRLKKNEYVKLLKRERRARGLKD